MTIEYLRTTDDPSMGRFTVLVVEEDLYCRAFPDLVWGVVNVQVRATKTFRVAAGTIDHSRGLGNHAAPLFSGDYVRTRCEALKIPVDGCPLHDDSSASDRITNRFSV